MKKITFVFLRGCSPRFSAPGQPPGRRRWYRLIRSGTLALGKPIQDDSSPESSFIEAISSAKPTAILFAITTAVAVSLCPRLLADNDHNPIGVTGVFEGVITTGGAYNVVNHSATRQIDDIVVPGAVGKYGLKMTRYYNSRRTSSYLLMGPGWSYENFWTSVNGDRIDYPNGNVWDSHCTGDWTPLGGPLGVSDAPTSWNGYGAFRLADGGTVVFGNPSWGVATKVIDPYGQTTDITLDTVGRTTQVKEPGGRYLKFFYEDPDVSWLITKVEAHGHGDATVTDSVVYHYQWQVPGGQGQQSLKCLTQVDYSDGQYAYYTYQADNSPDHPNPPCPCPVKAFPVLKTCRDVRYNGAMRNISYDYQDQGPHGAITAERYSINGSTNGVQVSKIAPAAPSPLLQSVTFPATYTETRADGPTRTFNYTALSIVRPPPEEECPSFTGPAPQQFLQSYTDFQNHTTQLGYDGNWYVNSVTDANNHATSYLRGPPPNAYPGPKGIGQILKITHLGDGTHIDYTYQDESPNISGHYVATVSDERQKITTYSRDFTTHRVTRIDYPADANTPASYEEFTVYNSFGQVLTHHLRNGAWESFVYDGRGLLTDKYNPKQTGIPGGSDPHIHYSYYTSGPWTDRVQKMTLPVNASGFQASETYEYDRTLGADGTTDPAGTIVAGRGLITKITHADNHYQSFGYDAYGNKRWEENELSQHSTYTYDEYKRLLTAKNPLLKTTTYTYVPTNGGGGSSYEHTTNNPDTVTTPTGIVTSNVYDANFRKTSTTAADGTALEATTTFAYDNVGNLTLVTDPLIHKTYNTYDTRNRKLTTTDAYQTALAHTTTWHYDAASNITQIDRPDTTIETKTYDAMNRALTDTVPKTSVPLVNLITSFTYNPSGTIQKVTDPNGHYTQSAYDASDRKVTMTYYDNSTQHWAYDDAGNLKNRTTVSGKIQTFAYDNRNRKTGMTWSNQADSATYGYDLVGRLTSAVNPNSTVTRQYDAAGHLTLDQQNVVGLGSKSVSYPTYDADGRLTRMYVVGVSGYDFTYSYDDMGRFETISLTNSSLLFQYHYDAASNETERDNVYNGVNQIYPRDALNRMQYMDVKKGTTILSHEWYTYDPMDRITVVTSYTGTDSFSYYLDGELNTATLGNLGHTLTYNLDKMGNRTSVVDNNVTQTYTPNTINQYAAAIGQSVTNGPEHEIQMYNGVTYDYINDERLNSASTGSTTYSIAYDALGRCVKRSLTGGPTTYYIYDGEKPILEYGPGWASAGVNVYGKGIDEIVERVAIGSDTYWYAYFPQQNHEGSVNLLTDSNGSVIERYRYDAFGAPTVYTGTWGARSNTIYDNRFLFTGREYAATYRSTYTTTVFNFYEYRARAYNPQLGRFMSEDPKLFEAGDYNLFRYCHNDPIDSTDPMGTEDQNYAGLAPREVSRMRADDSGNAQWAMAKWADGSNNFQGSFRQFAAGQSLTIGQIGSGIRVERAIPIRGQRDPMLDRRTENNLATLAEPVQKMARSLLYHSRTDLGLETRIIQGTRTYAEQNALYAQGRTTPGPVVTNARGGYSFHNFGVAFDVGLFRGRAYVEEGSGYTSVGHLGERTGLEWGGRWRGFQDNPHFQYPGLSLDGLRSRFEQGLSPIPGY